jgi:uncharacterized membrane protein YidH (DUF202 family)
VSRLVWVGAVPVLMLLWFLVGTFVCATADMFATWMGHNSRSKLWREPVAVIAWPFVAVCLVVAFAMVLGAVCYHALRFVFSDG